MAYNERILVGPVSDLDPDDTTWQAQVKNTSGTNVGSPITSGFTYVGGGAWTWAHTFDDGNWTVVFTPTDTDFDDIELVSLVSPPPSNEQAGPGAHLVEMTFFDALSVDKVLDGVEAWVTSTDSPAAATIVSDTSDSDGKVHFMLDPGTYFLWRQKGSYNTPEAVEFVVEDDGTWALVVEGP